MEAEHLELGAWGPAAGGSYPGRDIARSVYSGSPIGISKSQFSLYGVRENLASVRSRETLPDFSPRSMARLGRPNAEPSSTCSQLWFPSTESIDYE